MGAVWNCNCSEVCDTCKTSESVNEWPMGHCSATVYKPIVYASWSASWWKARPFLSWLCIMELCVFKVLCAWVRAVTLTHRKVSLTLTQPLALWATLMLWVHSHSRIMPKWAWSFFLVCVWIIYFVLVWICLILLPPTSVSWLVLFCNNLHQLYRLPQLNEAVLVSAILQYYDL